MKAHTTHFDGCDCVMKELDELRKDKARFDWMIENNAMINKSRNIFYCEIINGSAVRSFGELSPRDAIDAAIQETNVGK